MSHQSNLIETDILAYLKKQEHKSLLKFITCGSVDDGKSTLIGRLLYESKLIYEDQLAALEKDSKKVGTQGDNIDFALLVDGLASEREQGITIDVAYRYFSTDKRKFIVADTPGHEQYTRNMATGASTADLAIVMVDARQGVLTQTKRHSLIVKLLGVGHIVLAINKMDLVGYKQDIYNEIVKTYQDFALSTGIKKVTPIPVSALKGDNMLKNSEQMSWYKGPSLMHFLETVDIPVAAQHAAFSMPVQWVNRPHLDFRGFAGQITSGSIKPGDNITVLPSKQSSKVASIVTFDGNPDMACTGESVTLTLEDEIDISRGDVLVSDNTKVSTGHEFLTTLLWMSEDELVPGKSYWIKTRASLFSLTVEAPNYLLNVNTQKQEQSLTLRLNEIGQCVCHFDKDIAFEPYEINSHLGSFILIDKMTNNTVAMGLIEKSLSSVSWAISHAKLRDKYWQKGKVLNNDRVFKNNHKPLLIVLTGASSSKEFLNIGSDLEQALFEKNIQIYRYGFQFLRFVDADSQSVSLLREDMIKQLMDIAYAFLDAGMVFITSVRRLSAQDLAHMKTLVAPFNLLLIGLGQDQLDCDINCSDFKKDKQAILSHILNQV